MSFAHEHRSGPASEAGDTAPSVRVRAHSFRIPIVRDVAVIGLWAAVDRETMLKVLLLMTRETFVGIDVQDDTVKAILVRKSILRKISWDSIERIVLTNAKPLMAKSEILALTLEIEVALGETFLGPVP